MQSGSTVQPSPPLDPSLLTPLFSVPQALRSRLRPIMDASMNPTADATSQLSDRLDELEKTLFSAGHTSVLRHQRWKRRETEQITTDANVEIYRKRKAAQMDL